MNHRTSYKKEPEHEREFLHNLHEQYYSKRKRRLQIRQEESRQLHLFDEPDRAGSRLKKRSGPREG